MIIFDLDGTLWNVIKITEKMAMEVARQNLDIVDFDKSVVTKGMGLGLEENAKLFYPYLSKKKREDYVIQIINKINAYIQENGADIYEGASETIKVLSKDYKLAIVTNSTDEYVRAFYKASGLGKYFVDYMGAASYEVSKGEAIKRVVDRNGDEKNWYIGDIEKDMLASKEAGVEFIHANYGFGYDFTYENSVEDITMVPSLLKNLDNK